jgi:hypothetical protein
MKLTLCNRSISKDHQMAIHRAGCVDVARTEIPRWGASVQDVEVGCVSEAMGILLDAELVEMGYTADHVKVYPCCKGAK